MSPAQFYPEMWVPPPSSPLFPTTHNTPNMPHNPPAPTSDTQTIDNQAAGCSLSQQIPSTVPVSDQTFIRPYLDSGFEPSDVHRVMTTIIKSKFDYYANTWKEVPDEMKGIYFQEFKKRYRWDPADDHGVMKAWNKKNGGLMRGMMEKVRQKKDKGE
ncbi:uncharacterized protein LOC120015293 [Tripterygium wilfordii]|uniref:uncharacterized protein LOC120015293 n=1 Tax=Tripterygium wilfordii TaxID=458696 RepID=UPI0018F8437E|nr:uncharacterized protein LOC120015293 [Tripterygium wilfordii]